VLLSWSLTASGFCNFWHVSLRALCEVGCVLSTPGAGFSSLCARQCVLCFAHLLAHIIWHCVVGIGLCGRILARVLWAFVPRRVCIDQLLACVFCCSVPGMVHFVQTQGAICTISCVSLSLCARRCAQVLKPCCRLLFAISGTCLCRWGALCTMSHVFVGLCQAGCAEALCFCLKALLLPDFTWGVSLSLCGRQGVL
jgi:hypothetical protein